MTVTPAQALRGECGDNTVITGLPFYAYCHTQIVDDDKVSDPRAYTDALATVKAFLTTTVAGER